MANLYFYPLNQKEIKCQFITFLGPNSKLTSAHLPERYPSNLVHSQRTVMIDLELDGLNHSS